MLSYYDAFKDEVEAFLLATEMDPTTFGKEALGDPSFVFDLRNKGRSPSGRTMDRVRQWMTDRRQSQTQGAAA